MERNTRQRSAILSAFEREARPLSPEELLAAAREYVPSLGLATVYRNVKLLVEEGLLVPVPLAGQITRYELASLHHHHHFQCTRCHRVFDLDRCPGSFRDIAPPGFVVQDHDLTLYGVCPSCQPAPRRSTPPKSRRTGKPR
jgi:Fur family ferric uptake transcriptional regulator